MRSARVVERSVKMSIKHALAILSLGLWSLGCSGADVATPRGGTIRGAIPGAGSPTGAAGAAGSNSDATNGSFGNTNGNTGVISSTSPDAGSNCVQGMRCYDNTEADTNDCGHQTLDSSVKTVEMPGNVLLVFDTSGSMNDDWNGTPRWQAAGDAIQSALMPLADLLTVGTIFFPRADPNAPAQCVDPTGIACIFVPFLVLPSGTCGVTPITSNDQINFQPGPQFLTTFAGPGGNSAPPYAPVPGGRTPLSEALQQAKAALDSTTLSGITAVILITDGDPNCSWDEGAANKVVSDWNAAGIQTYVLGLPGLSGSGEMLLNDLAAAGGTGMYIPPSDPKALADKLQEIVSSTVRSGIDSCSIDLNPPAEVPDKLHLVVTQNGTDQDVPRDLSKDVGWSVTSDGSTVTLQGQLCDEAKSGMFDSLRFDFGCVDLPPWQPPPPPD